MGLIGRIFGADKSIEKGVDVLAKGLDKLVYTSEEKAQDNAKAVTEARSMLVKWLEASQGQRLSRRVIALSITFTWLFMYLMGFVVSIMSIWLPDNRLNETITIISEYTDSMNGAVMLILGFYFAMPHLDKIISPAMAKFSKTK